MTQRSPSPDSVDSPALTGEPGLAGAPPAARLRPPGRPVLDARRFDIRDYIVYISFLVILLFFAVTLRDTGFLTWNNFMSIIRGTTPITVMAVGMVFVLAAGEIDLSIGAILALAALAVSLALRYTGSVPVAILVGLGVGLLAGFVNGFVLVLLRIPSFLVTLGTLSVFQGLARATTLEAVPITADTYNFWFGSGQVGDLTILLVWSLGIVWIGYLLFNNTRFGRRVLATGGNRTAAVSVGIKVNRVKLSVFMISGLLAGLAGMLY
ncbi:MAG TPA: ABC transporter permease, partial [Chloroflexia bacterium]|nr:ABC transporter permease [Chloroflexia bacterium]